MSRTNIEGKTYDIAFGVDHVTGPFLQVWKKPASEQDGCFLKVEGKNLITDEDSEEYKGLPLRARNYIKDCVSRMQNGQGDYLGADHMLNIIRSLDEFDDDSAVRTAVYTALD